MLQNTNSELSADNGHERLYHPGGQPLSAEVLYLPREDEATRKSFAERCFAIHALVGSIVRWRSASGPKDRAVCECPIDANLHRSNM